MLQWLCTYVARVCSKCFIRFRRMIQVFYLDVVYVANVCSKCFICFRRILQLVHLSVAKVDLDIELLSEEERASAGAMAASI
jgi:hypothetical protein